MDCLHELMKHLNFDAELSVQAYTLDTILGLAGTQDGRDLLLSCPEILRRLILLCQINCKRLGIAKEAACALINMSGDESGAKALLLISESSKIDFPKQPTDNLIHVCFNCILDKESQLADPCCMILSNMTRPASSVDRIVALAVQANYNWDQIINAFAYASSYNTTGANLHYLGPVLSNLSQSAVVRRRLADRTHPVIHKLLPFTEFKESLTRRGGVVGTLKNCCFDPENHLWLLSDEVDILPHLLLPLAGPEEFDEEDNDKLPLDLQYLPETKEREKDLDIRIMLLEALCQLCATQEGRKIMRDKNAYIILREYHKWETDRTALLACENVIDILIRTEDEIGLDNLKSVDVPTEYTEKFHKMDEDFLKESE